MTHAWHDDHPGRAGSRDGLLTDVSRTLQKLAASDWPVSASSCYIPGHRWRRVPPGFKGESMHKRALAAVAVTGVAALALSACGGSSPTTPSNTGAAGTAGSAGSSKATTSGTPETPSGTAAPVRDANVDLVIWTDADRSKAVQKYADEFAAENGVTVKVQISTDTRAQFKDATKVGKGPDVIV